MKLLERKNRAVFRYETAGLRFENLQNQTGGIGRNLNSDLRQNGLASIAVDSSEELRMRPKPLQLLKAQFDFHATHSIRNHRRHRDRLHSRTSPCRGLRIQACRCMARQFHLGSNSRLGNDASPPQLVQPALSSRTF